MNDSSRKDMLDRAAALLAHDPAAAERKAREVLAAVSGNPNATLILGSALRRQGRADQAIAVLAPLVATFPRAAISRFELGMALADLGRADEAIEELRTATELDVSNPDAWQALGALLFDRGDARGADAAFANHHLSLVRDPALYPAVEALQSGRLPEAEAMLRSFVQLRPDDHLATTLYAEALSRRGKHTDAAVLLRLVLKKAPSNHLVRFRLARELYQEQDFEGTIEELGRLLAAEPGNPSYRNLMAGALAQASDFDAAIALYESLLQSHPDVSPTWTNYAHSLRVVGRSADATAAYRRSIALDSMSDDAYLGLANLKNASLNEADIAEMRELSQRSDLTEVARERLAYALGQGLEDRGDYAGAFAAYAAGAAAHAERGAYRADDFTRSARSVTSLMNARFFEDRADFGAPNPDPIFIVGLPRSGSSLIEQILSSHSKVEGLGELRDLPDIMARIGALPEGAKVLARENSVALGEAYVAASRARRRASRAFFVDKLPNNFFYTGLIHLVLPNAKIIDARRHPMACCFSAFKQHFAQGQEFSYRLRDVGHYYRDYVRLMAHFDQVLPGRVHRVIYEELVDDPQREISSLLDYCGLEFEPACLAFHETERAVRTPSSEQVRRPIFREGLEQWRHFAPWLAPLEEALGPALDTWRR
jgi:predicted Zn-dependent protease